MRITFGPSLHLNRQKTLSERIGGGQNCQHLRYLLFTSQSHCTYLSARLSLLALFFRIIHTSRLDNHQKQEENRQTEPAHDHQHKTTTCLNLLLV